MERTTRVGLVVGSFKPIELQDSLAVAVQELRKNFAARYTGYFYVFLQGGRSASFSVLSKWDECEEISKVYHIS